MGHDSEFGRHCCRVGLVLPYASGKQFRMYTVQMMVEAFLPQAGDSPWSGFGGEENDEMS